jgi:hypothetical protein
LERSSDIHKREDKTEKVSTVHNISVSISKLIIYYLRRMMNIWRRVWGLMVGRIRLIGLSISRCKARIRSTRVGNSYRSSILITVGLRRIGVGLVVPWGWCTIGLLGRGLHMTIGLRVVRLRWLKLRSRILHRRREFYWCRFSPGAARTGGLRNIKRFVPAPLLRLVNKEGFRGGVVGRRWGRGFIDEKWWLVSSAWIHGLRLYKIIWFRLG